MPAEEYAQEVLQDVETIESEIAQLKSDVEQLILEIDGGPSEEMPADEYEKKVEEVEAILGKDGKPGRLDKARAKLERAVKIRNLRAENRAEVGNRLRAQLDTQFQQISNIGSSNGIVAMAQHRRAPIVIPSRCKNWTKLRAFKGDGAEERAYSVGRWLMAAFGGDYQSQKWCESHGVSLLDDRGRPVNAMGISNPVKGGFLVPDELLSTLIDLREQFGIARQYSRVVPMTTDTLDIPRRDDGLTVYFVGENAPITESEPSLGSVKLTAKKLAALTRISSELDEDAIISIADMVAEEMAYALAEREDQCLFNGAGGSLHGGITGLENALLAGSVVTATGETSFGAITVGRFETVAGRLPQFSGQQPAWFISKPAYFATMGRLAMAAGGNNTIDFGKGPELSYLGYPVVFVNVMPKATASAKIFAYFGDLSQATTMGVRRDVTMAFSTDRYFENDQLAWRVTERFDLVVHEVGTATEPGAVIALKTA
jgi:HK97 family phage major capsid protein